LEDRSSSVVSSGSLSGSSSRIFRAVETSLLCDRKSEPRLSSDAQGIAGITE
jgi:hypothetical protein